MSESQDRRSVLFSPQGLPGLMTGAGTCGVQSVLPGGPLYPPAGPYLVSEESFRVSPLPS